MTRELYQEQLRRLNGELILMGDLCEEAMRSALQAIAEADEAQTEEVHRLEREIDAKEQDISSMCMSILLRQQPVARDLRSISAAIRMIADLERIGDQTADIADTCKYLTRKQTGIHPHLLQMGKYASQMVNDAVNAFVHKDQKLAEEVIAMDDRVDDLFNEVKAELVQEIQQDTCQDGHELDMLMVAKYLERIGDHAVNVGEWVLYSITGKTKKEL